MLKAPPWDIPPLPLLATKLVTNSNLSRLENLKNGGVWENPSGGGGGWGGVYFTTVNNTSMVYIRKSTPRYCYAYKTINSYLSNTPTYYYIKHTHVQQPFRRSLRSIYSTDYQEFASNFSVHSGTKLNCTP